MKAAKLPEEGVGGGLAQKKSESGSEIFSYFDINQLELALINRALKGIETRKKLSAKIAKTTRILLLQKSNLESLLKGLNKVCNEAELENELRKILSGNKIPSIRYFPPIGDD